MNMHQNRKEGMRISLILCSINTQKRVPELHRLLDSLLLQVHKNFEVVFVDQNDVFDVHKILEGYSDQLDIVYIRSKPGLSTSRNVGLTHAKGEIVGFPDDDCWYKPNTLETVNRFFQSKHKYTFFHGKGSDEYGRDMARFKDGKLECSLYNIFQCSVSCGIFGDLKTVRSINGFDDRLGLGAKTRWTGCEDYELPIRAIKSGYKIFFDSAFVVHHPYIYKEINDALISRAKEQSPSYGAVLKMHNYPIWFKTYTLLRPMAGAALAFLSFRRKKGAYHLAVFLGRAEGMKNCDLIPINEK